MKTVTCKGLGPYSQKRTQSFAGPQTTHTHTRKNNIHDQYSRLFCGFVNCCVLFVNKAPDVGKNSPRSLMKRQ